MTKRAKSTKAVDLRGRGDYTKLLKQLRDCGYELSYTNGGHIRVRMSQSRRERLMRNGFDVASSPAQVILPCSASDHRGLKNAKSQLKQIGFTASS